MRAHQSRELSVLTGDKRRLEEDKRNLKERLKEMTSLASNFRSEKERINEIMNQQTARLHATQMELTLVQHRTREAGITSGRAAPFLDTQPQLDIAVSRPNNRFAVSLPIVMHGMFFSCATTGTDQRYYCIIGPSIRDQVLSSQFVYMFPK